MTRRRYLRQESSRVLEKLRSGAELRLRLVRRRQSAAVRLAFGDGDVVQHATVETLVSRGLARLDADGAVRIAPAAAERRPGTEGGM